MYFAIGIILSSIFIIGMIGFAFASLTNPIPDEFIHGNNPVCGDMNDYWMEKANPNNCIQKCFIQDLWFIWGEFKTCYWDVQ